ncbi:MAG: hypothetical protein ACQ9MH_03810 [Nitrospinales bacterium]
MKIFGRVLMVLMIAASFGCQTTQGQSGGATSTSTYEAPAATSAPASTSSSSSSGVRMLTDADYKRMGVRETYDLR